MVLVKTFELLSHPDHPASGISRVSAEIFRMAGGTFDLEFDVHGRSAEDICEDVGEPAFANDLWQSTCFEAFLTASNNSGYIELNFTPSGLWAAYHFDHYRQGMRRLPEVDMEGGVSCSWSQAISIRTGGYLPMLPADLPWTANIAAVIEEADGTKSYWALAHAPGPPDFHNRDCFIATLPAPERA